jgi:hypothetical protein
VVDAPSQRFGRVWRAAAGDIRECRRRITPLCWAVGSALICALQVGAQPVEGGITARIEPSASVFNSGGPVCVRLALENSSDRHVLLPITFSALKQFDGKSTPVFPDIVIVPALTSPRGRRIPFNPVPILGMRTVIPEDFALLGPSSSTGMSWDLTGGPWNFSIREEGSYTLRMRLYFFMPRWLTRMQKNRFWLVTPEALALVRRNRDSLYEGSAETNPIKLRICVRRSGSSCPEPKISPGPPHERCRAARVRAHAAN